MRYIENFNVHKSDVTSNARWLRRHPGKSILERKGQSSTCPLDARCCKAFTHVPYNNPLITHVKKP